MHDLFNSKERNASQWCKDKDVTREFKNINTGKKPSIKFNSFVFSRRKRDTVMRIQKKLEAVFSINPVLHTTRNNIDYTFKEFKDGKLFFNIPSRKHAKKGNTKSVPLDVIEGKVMPYFTDCRLTVLKNILKNFQPL
jgi:hypothetical protein